MALLPNPRKMGALITKPGPTECEEIEIIASILFAAQPRFNLFATNFYGSRVVRLSNEFCSEPPDYR